MSIFTLGEIFEFVSFTGGFPVFSPNFKEDISSNLKCSCDLPAKFIAQLYCPVDDSHFDRIIYIFACVSKDCKERKWFAVRCISMMIQNREVMNEQLFENDNDWDDDDDDDDESIEDCEEQQQDQVAEGFEEMKLPSTDNFFQPYYISVIEEPTNDDDASNEHVNNLLKHYKEKNKLDDASAKMLEDYEKNQLNEIYGGDNVTYNFFKRLNRCSNQIIRYSWRGKPLMNSTLNKVNISQCGNCNDERCFEVQLMPALINFLKSQNEILIDFGTIIIYSCSNNCSLKPVCFEEVLILPDPDEDALLSLSNNK